MSQIVPRMDNTVDSYQGHSAGRVPRDVVRAVQREVSRGLVVGARLEAGAYAARTALVNTALLSKEEESCIQLAPLGELRYKAIVDAYAIYAAGEIGNL